MKNAKVILSLLIVALLAFGFVAGCNSSSDDGGDGSTGSVAGTVTDANGNAIVGATCTIDTDLPEDAGREVYSDTTDENGDFLLTGVPEGTWNLEIAATGYNTLEVSVSVSGDTTTTVPADQTIVTPTGYGTVTGTVTDAGTGAGLTGVAITVGGVSGTSSAGTYTISNVPSGTQTVTATATGYNNYSSTVAVTADATATHNIAMTATTPSPSPTVTTVPSPEPDKGNVAGTVTDATSGSALSGVSVSVNDGIGTTTGTTDANGAYTLYNVQNGARTITATMTGYDNYSASITVPNGSTLTHNFTMNSAATVGEIKLVSTLTGVRTQASNNSSVTDDGSVVVFESKDPKITNQSSDGKINIFAWTRSTGSMTRVSMTPLGENGDGDSQNAQIAGNGRYVVYDSAATNLIGVGADTNGVNDVFKADLSAAIASRTARVSTNSSGAQIGVAGDTCASTNPTCDADCANVAFAHVTGAATILGTGDNAASIHIATKNLAAGTLTWVDQITAGGGLTAQGAAAGNRGLSPKISRNGTYIVFLSNAIDLDANNNNMSATGAQVDANRYVYLYNRTNAGCVAVSLTTAGAAVAGQVAVRPTISDDGTKVAFASNVALAANGAPAGTDVYLRNTSAATTSWVSASTTGRAASTNPYISADGNLVAFQSTSTDLVSNDNNLASDVFVKNMSTGTVTRVSTTSANAEANGNSTMPCISGNGNFVSFESVATNLVSDTNLQNAINSIYLKRWQ